MTEKKTIINACIDELIRIKDDDLLLPVHIIIPGAGYGWNFRRAVLEKGLSFANISTTTFRGHIADAAEDIFLSRGLKIADTLEAHDIIREILLADAVKLDYFEGSKEYRIMPGLLHHVFTEMELNGDKDSIIEAFAKLDVKGKELGLLYRSYCKGLEKNGLAAYSDAVAAFGESVMDDDAWYIVFPGIVENLSQAEQAILHNLDKQKRLVHIDLDDNVRGAVEFTSASCDAAEVRTVCRRIMELISAEEVKLEDMAVVCPDSRYLELFHAVMEEAAIPHYIPSGVLRSGTGSFAVMDALAGIILRDFDFQDVKAYLLTASHVPFFKKDDPSSSVSTSMLLRTARKYGAAGGYDEWLASLAAGRVGISESGYGDDWKQAETGRVDNLEKLVRRLGDSAGRFSMTAAAGEFASLALELMEIFVPHDELYNGLAKIIRRTGSLRSVRTMDGEEYFEMLESITGSYRTTTGIREGSVYVTTEIDPGLFKYVFAAGLTEQEFPRRIRQDPIISDDDIEKINGIDGFNLETTALKRERAIVRYGRFIGSATGKWLGSFPGADILSGKTMFPTPLAYSIFEMATGSPFNVEEMNAALRSSMQNADLFPAAPEQGITGLEYGTVSVLNDRKQIAALTGLYPSVLRCYNSEAARWSTKQFNEHTGIVGKNLYREGLRFSATTAVDFVRCPYRYFLKNHLGLRRIEEPVAAEDLDVMQAGTLVHEILEKFMKRVKSEKISVDAYSTVMDDIVHQEFRAFEHEHAPRYQSAWDKRKLDILDFVNNFLDFEKENSEEPLEFELTFGREGYEPITLDMGGFSADFSGKIDRLDKTADGFAIIDYKTSSDYGYRSGVLDGGRRIQPFIYAELYRVKEGLGDDAVIKAGFLTLKDKSTLIVNPYNEEIRGALEDIFAYMRGVLEQGYFFETADCQYCDFTGVCSSYCGYHVEKKLQNGNDLVEKYLSISELE